MTSRLEALDLAIGHGTVLADGLSLSVAPAEIVAIVGPSGSGKSTLLASLAGVVPALGGRVLVDGIDVTTWPVHRRRIGMIFQEPLLFPHLDVGDNVAYGLRRLGQNRRDARAQAVEALAWVGLDGYADRPVERLSGGQAQRVALARALAPRPAVLLLDEPFSALDADLRQRLAADVAGLLRREATAAVHVTHDLDEAAAMADRVLRMPPEPGQPLARVPR
ncbi:MAG: ABC transporter ATP-binding protein [Actinomycetota bacterium]|nr:ABC transporter ATP-binding protein [Actinomycetota bacterium]